MFENGERSTADFIVAADGIRSTLRKYVTGEEIQPQYGGYVNWNGLAPASEDLAPKNSWVIYVGEHKRTSMIPVAGDRFYFFFDAPLPKGTPANPENYRSELAELFQGWAKPVQTLIERVDSFKTNRPEIHDVGPLNHLVRGRVALLGNSGHATCPDLGQGDAQAMEDAFILTQSLLKTNLDMDDALKHYEAKRKERTGAVVQKARKRAETIHGKDAELTQKWYQQLAQENPTEVTSAISKVILAEPLH